MTATRVLRSYVRACAVEITHVADSLHDVVGMAKRDSEDSIRKEVESVGGNFMPSLTKHEITIHGDRVAIYTTGYALVPGKE